METLIVSVCPAPSITGITNGIVVYNQVGSTVSYLQGTLATLSCYPGYAIVGTASLNCTSTAVWNPTSFGTCNEGLNNYCNYRLSVIFIYSACNFFAIFHKCNRFE
jgi:hypothetical protein